jgi:uncharacterized protein (TIGR00304 family)
MNGKMATLGELLSLLGIFILVVGIVLVIVGVISVIARRSSRRNGDKEGEGKRNEGKVRAGGVVIVGPIPVIFGTDWKTLVIAVIAAITFIVIYAMVSSSWSLP